MREDGGESGRHVHLKKKKRKRGVGGWRDRGGTEWWVRGRNASSRWPVREEETTARRCVGSRHKVSRGGEVGDEVQVASFSLVLRTLPRFFIF